jgi:serine protease AprX
MNTKKPKPVKKGSTGNVKRNAVVIPREQLEELIYGGGGGRRFTQDSPILPDVWFEFGKNPNGRADLLLNPHYDSSPELVAKLVEYRLSQEQASGAAKRFACDDKTDPAIAYNQSTVVARLCFHELVRVVLPLTPWWNNFVWRGDGHDLNRFIKDKGMRARLVKVLDNEGEIEAAETDDTSPDGDNRGWEPQLIWMMKVIGTIAAAGNRKGTSKKLPSGSAVVEGCAKLVDDLLPLGREQQSMIWSVTRNRPATAAIWRSTMAVKADATRRLFQVSCKDLVWAVIDSGVDARHPAFRIRRPDGKPLDEPFKDEGAGEKKPWKNQTRVVASYDFSIIRYLLQSNPDITTTFASDQQKRFVKAKRRIDAHPELAKELRSGLVNGRSIDWNLLKPLLEIPHTDQYSPPRHDHGTHVAGILAADWRETDPQSSGDTQMGGVCPDLRLYDLRVLDDNGRGDEFSVIAALQFIRHLNAHKDVMLIHGANLSLSIRHDVANYACGRTPICEEAERLVGAGIIVVAAAGNNGYLYFMTPTGIAEEGYRSISITDPGNAEGVITVGATHRERAHTYGVSYFSSRGPTGDGRFKPDLVAPGEKIVSTIPNAESKRLDGTSMAAPHVSGAAALLIARYQELVGRPSKVKEILCQTATDLGREKYFQGSGMLDILRALQSV